MTKRHINRIRKVRLLQKRENPDTQRFQRWLDDRETEYALLSDLLNYPAYDPRTQEGANKRFAVNARLIELENLAEGLGMR